MDRRQLDTTQFLLVPDSGAARRLRRLLAQGGARTGVLVGTWQELLDYAAHAYLLPAPAGDWPGRLHQALESMPDAFWAASLEVAPTETAESVEHALHQIVSACDPGAGLGRLDTSELPRRARAHLDDLVQLVERLNGALPDDLATIRDLLATDAADAIRHIPVAHVPEAPRLTRWQSALLDKLNEDAGATVDRDLAKALHAILAPADDSSRSSHSRHRDEYMDAGGRATQETKAGRSEAIHDANEAGDTTIPSAQHDGARGEATAQQTSLDKLQTGLYLPPTHAAPLDNTLQWIGARDYLAEVETAAGMIQTLLDRDPDLQPADIGVLLPDDFIYAVAVDDVFTRAGLAVSGLPLEHWQRDLGREAVFHFLYCRDKPAPAMALAVCLTSPLMSWAREDGAVLAQAVMDGDYRLRPLRHAGPDARGMLDLIRDGDEAPATLGRALRDFAGLLDGGDEHAGHAVQARNTVEELCRALETMDEIDWAALRRQAGPKTLAAGEGPDFNLDGVAIWRESQEAWRPVRHLIVCGFGAGRYPLASMDSPVFSSDDLHAIREQLGLLVDTPADALARRRARFRRQLASAADSVSFLVPRRDPAGAAQAPSESLVFMHQLFDTPGADQAEDLILELDAAADRERIRFLAQAPGAEPRPPRPLTVADIDFDRDLLALRMDTEGNPKSESPSSLETLMVSRLAWLLRRLDAEPLGWAPEALDPMLMGTLAHQVFEVLFPTGGPLPEEQGMQARVDRLLDDAITRSAPFLRAAQWQVERRHLAGEITRAALAWRHILAGLDAELLANEIWLAGDLNGVPIHGQADALLGLPGDRLLVVDYKRSSSNSRRPRMEKGYDSQASLYRTMLETGGPKDETDTELRDRLHRAQQTSVVYYMLNDQRALSDSSVWDVGSIPGWEPVKGDIASHALALINQRLHEVRKGRLTLNREEDAEFFDKQAGIKPYALDNSPLIPLFTIKNGDGGIKN